MFAVAVIVNVTVPPTLPKYSVPLLAPNPVDESKVTEDTTCPAPTGDALNWIGVESLERVKLNEACVEKPISVWIIDGEVVPLIKQNAPFAQ